jgi:uncharacterized membrane protein YraQ (UPF0718 family)
VHAAVALARSLFRKGANFTAAMAFELASTNLVAELAIIMVVLLRWQFAAAEFIGAPVMVAILAGLFRLFLKPSMVDEARTQTERGLHGRMEGHAEMNMTVTEGPVLKRILSDRGQTAISQVGLLRRTVLPIVLYLPIASGSFRTGRPAVAH